MHLVDRVAERDGGDGPAGGDDILGLYHHPGVGERTYFAKATKVKREWGENEERERERGRRCGGRAYVEYFLAEVFHAVQCNEPAAWSESGFVIL